MRLTILGCGASGGVPLIGCRCTTCSSDNRRNMRRRASILIEEGSTRLLIDLSPDLRLQALDNGISTVDAMLLTHDHADHMHGVDDAKGFNFHRKGPIPCYGDAVTLHALRERFAYAIAKPDAPYYGHKPALEPIIIKPYQSVTLGAMEVKTFLQLHGKMPTMGVRVGNIAYSTDVNNLPEKSLQALESLDVWVVDCLQREPAPTHAHLAMALGWVERLKPKLAILTHMSHVLEYGQMKRELPAGVIPAHDGLFIHMDTAIPGVFAY